MRVAAACGKPRVRAESPPCGSSVPVERPLMPPGVGRNQACAVDDDVRVLESQISGEDRRTGRDPRRIARRLRADVDHKHAASFQIFEQFVGGFSCDVYEDPWIDFHDLHNTIFPSPLLFNAPPQRSRNATTFVGADK
jgi:hypothetical protein